jgi:hypothetical protein
MVDDYSDSSIYRIYNRNNPSDFYIGSTRCIRRRISCHYDACNNENNPHYNLKLYTHIRENGHWGFWIIDEIYNFSCNNIEELREKEQEFINRLKPSLNTNRASKTEKLIEEEYCKIVNARPSRTLEW